MRIYLVFLCLILNPLNLQSQQRMLSDQAEISVLTVGPGKNLNDVFGHNGFRIKDKVRGIDVVFNYGVYDFEAPNFYLKFAQGKLNYMIGLNYYEDFYNLYNYQNRTISEQVLNLSQDEKQRIFNFLSENYKPENRFYLYDFFYDNCATKMRDVLETVLPQDLNFKTPDSFEGRTFRQLIHEHVNRNGWGSFGIDLALGSVIDKEATPREFMFLPKYIHSFLDVAERSDRDKLVKSSRIIYKARPEKKGMGFLYSPLFILGIIALIILYITFQDHKKSKQSKWLDLTMFLVTGIAGLIILLLWFATDHSATAHNYNLLWAIPLNLILWPSLLKKSPKLWFRRYIKFLLIMLILLILHWVSGVQVYAIGLIPIMIAMVARYIYLIQYYGKLNTKIGQKPS
ncbi:MAG: DUF4105 domain-containing protein [Bacteroidia bacterium]|nr:DUF4105 domain-containing protein [Bacteroidia bacterium]